MADVLWQRVHRSETAQAANAPAVHKNTGWGGLVEVAVAFAILEAGLWTEGRAQVLCGLLLLAWLVVCALRSRRSARELGLTAKGFVQLFWIVPAALLAGGNMIVAAYFAGTLHGLHGLHTPLWHAALYAIWALVQEYIAQSFMFVRLEAAFGSSRAVWMTGGLFALAHIPNGILIGATLLMGVLWSELFRRYRNIYPLAIAHGILGLALAVALPEAATHHMRVGIAWWK